MITSPVETSPLGKKSPYIQSYTPSLLHPIPRSLGRDHLLSPHIDRNLLLKGVDIFRCYELSWLNLEGKPEVTKARLTIPSSTPMIIESKSLKLYFNSFNHSKFTSIDEVQTIAHQDLSKALQGDLSIDLFTKGKDFPPFLLTDKLLDDLPVTIDHYTPTPSLLQSEEPIVSEQLHSHLLKSNCLATGQPDFGSLFLSYRGRQIDHQGLLSYIISYRNHAGFAEHCAEQMFCDLLERCSCEELSLFVTYTRRGGIDISSFRSTFEDCLF